MQENTTIARPYAGAVFELARQEDNLQKWSNILHVLELVVTDANMKAVIHNPRIDHKQLADIVNEVCSEHLDEEGKNFVRILVNAERLSVIPQIRKLYDEKKAEAEGVAEVEVISAYELESEQQEKIKQVMAKKLGKKIEISTKIDESLIGGAIVRSGDSVIDASLRGRLRQLANAFAE